MWCYIPNIKALGPMVSYKKIFSYFSLYKPMYSQGCCRLFKSGPAEEAFECWRYERGRAQEGGDGMGGLPREHFWILSASICIFNGVLCVWDQILVILVTKICHVIEKPNAGQNCFQTVTCCCFFTFFFLQHVSLTLFHLCPRRF